ncbi:MAG: leucine-rich repeat protein [Clostridia bacterium]|nr:leucine-rich repeat protein [Clostridia bacterium]
MGRIDTLANCFTDICDAIRAKTGKTDKITPANITTEIASIPTGETPAIGYTVEQWDAEGNPTSMTFHGYNKIPDGMFYYNMGASKLEHIILTESVTEIGQHAFNGNKNLIDVTLPENLTVMGTMSFYGCNNLERINLSNSMTTIESYLFYECSKLDFDKLPDSITSIGEYAFYKCTNLSLSELPSGLTEIKNYTFKDCVNLALNTLPEKVTKVGSYAFDGCTNLALTELPETVTSWGSYAFRNSGVAIKTLPLLFNNANSRQIPNYFFYGCKNITDFTFPEVTNAGAQYRQIMAYAFAECTNLTMKEFPKAVYTINEKAFFNCTSLDVPELEVYNWNGNTANWSGKYAFSNTGLTKVKLTANAYQPSGSYMGSHMFANCLKLEEVTVTGRFEFGTNAFDSCPILKKFDIGFRTNQTTRVNLKSTMFQNCTSLDTVIIRYDNGISTLGATSAFNGTPIASGTGYIYVPSALIDTYKTATNWSTYADQIRAIEDYPEICGEVTA